MTRKLLEGYRSKKEEIRYIKYKLQHLGEGDSMVRSSTVLDYRSGHPVPQAIVGVDWDEMEEVRKRLEKRLGQLEPECQQVEEFISNIPDSMTHMIFEMYFMDGINQHKIARKIHIDQSYVSKIISNFVKLE